MCRISFTKCLSSQLFFKHRETLGFEERSMPNLSEEVVALIADDEACLDVTCGVEESSNLAC